MALHSVLGDLSTPLPSTPPELDLDAQDLLDELAVASILTTLREQGPDWAPVLLAAAAPEPLTRLQLLDAMRAHVWAAREDEALTPAQRHDRAALLVGLEAPSQLSSWHYQIQAHIRSRLATLSDISDPTPVCGWWVTASSSPPQHVRLNAPLSLDGLLLLSPDLYGIENPPYRLRLWREPALVVLDIKPTASSEASQLRVAGLPDPWATLTRRVHELVGEPRILHPLLSQATALATAELAELALFTLTPHQRAPRAPLAERASAVREALERVAALTHEPAELLGAACVLSRSFTGSLEQLLSVTRAALVASSPADGRGR